jgi:ABC-type multidrug transport system permease subunit
MFYTVIVYFKIGLTITASQYFYFYLTALLLSISCSSIGYFISSTVAKDETAVAVAPIVMMPLAQFGGFLVNTSTMPKWISWLQYISPIRYALESFTRNEFNSRTYTETQPNPVNYLGYNIGINKCLIFLACLAIGLRIITVYSLKKRVSRV